LISFAGNDWAVNASDDRYDSSRDGNLDLLRWVDRDAVYPIARFKEKKYVPHLLTQLLQEREETAR